MIADEACWERGCACHDSRDSPGVELVRKREWVGLTDDEIVASIDPSFPFKFNLAVIAFVRNIEAKLKEKNDH